MDDLRQQLTDNPQALVTFVTTEHFNLQTARAITTSESNGRAGHQYRRRSAEPSPFGED